MTHSPADCGEDLLDRPRDYAERQLLVELGLEEVADGNVRAARLLLTRWPLAEGYLTDDQARACRALLGLRRGAGLLVMLLWGVFTGSAIFLCLSTPW